MLDYNNIHNKLFIDDTRAVQDLICTENVNILLARMNFLSNILDNVNYDLILTYGTLLGIIRDDGFIVGDNDIDIGIILKTNIIGEFNNLCTYMRAYDITITRDYTGSTGHYHIKVMDRVLDLWLIWEDNKKLFLSDSILGDLNIDILFPLKQITWNKHEFKIPNNSARLFEYWYGKEWKIKSDKHPKFFLNKILKEKNDD